MKYYIANIEKKNDLASINLMLTSETSSNEMLCFLVLFTMFHQYCMFQPIIRYGCLQGSVEKSKVRTEEALFVLLSLLQ